jgi:hypothetical protein
VLETDVTASQSFSSRLRTDGYVALQWPQRSVSRRDVGAGLVAGVVFGTVLAESVFAPLGALVGYGYEWYLSRF